jgi:hypothetical protein
MNDLQKLYQAKAPEKASCAEKVKSVSQKMKQKQRITVAVLSVTAIVLIAFAIWTLGNASSIFRIGLILMIACVLFRIIAEMVFLNRFNYINPDKTTEDYAKAKGLYHEQRVVLHQKITPVLLTIYWIGFVLLIPQFSESLSNFMFWYVYISSVAIAAAMVWFIRHQIKQESRDLRHWAEIR